MGIPLSGLRLALATLLVAFAMPAPAGAAGVDAAGAIHSMFVRGTIEVDPQGKVQGYTIADAEAYSAPIRGMLERVIPRWTFRPVEDAGVPHAVRSPMFLRLEAQPAGEGQFKVVIASAAFGAGSNAVPSDSLAHRQMTPPKYPRDEIRAGIGAQVVAAVKVGRDGSVEDAVIEQTNLTRAGTSRDMARWRKDFEQTALAAVKQWRFVPPTTGPDAGRPYWSARVPMVYTPGTPARTTGRWQSFVPGPRRAVPWASESEVAAAGADALPGGGIFPMEPTLRLLTPLGAG